MKKSFPNFAREFIKVVIIVAVAVPVVNLMAAVWTGPSGAPPTNNADAPVNVGTTFQIKNGGLELKGGLTASGIIDKGALLLSPFMPDFSDPDVDAAMSQNGVIYYDSALKKFRCYEDGIWKDCVGAIAGGGGGISGYEIVRNPPGIGNADSYCGNCATRSTVTCPAGKKILGGGCRGVPDETFPLEVNGPLGDGWECSAAISAYGMYAVVAYAICANVP